MSNKKTAIYIHIPKTGGSTLQGIINRQYKNKEIFNVRNDRETKNYIELNEEQKKQIKILKGHMAFGHHKSFPNPNDVSYFTLLRDPVKRVISNYYFILERPSHRLHNEIAQNNYSLKDYVTSGIALNTENAQIRLLSNNIYTPHNECTKQMLKNVKANVEKHFSVVGINEMYDETIVMLQKYYNWKIPYYTRKNITKSKPKITEIDDSTLKVIADFNELDNKLYIWAKNRLKTQILEMGEEFDADLKKFKARNALVQKISKVKAKFLP
jgi:hypothetical protein